MSYYDFAGYATNTEQECGQYVLYDPHSGMYWSRSDELTNNPKLCFFIFNSIALAEAYMRKHQIVAQIKNLA